jgi:phosphatidylinositol glycan class B
MPTFTRFLSSRSSTPRVPTYDYLILLREGVLCGLTVLLLSAASDRLYYGEWTFPAYQWIDFNVSQDLAVFYGSNDWHYYISQGLPLLLTTYLPFALVGLWNSTSGNGLPFLLATTILTTLASLSLISHKEVRFIYPLLPLLHILAAPVVSCFFYTITTITTQPSLFTPPPKDKYSTVTIHAPTVSQQPKTETTVKTRRNPLLITILMINLLIGGYTTLFHQSGVISVMKYIRSEYETLALDAGGTLLSSPLANPVDTQGSRKISDYSDNETFVGFLMPCHSTPWRSKLFYPGLKAWALSCEPPIHLAPHSKERAEYRDEADRFYDDPIKFLKTEINTKGKPWPRYVVGFQGIEEVLKRYYEREMQGFVVKERWRTFNSHWHDDERRNGDVVVWEFVDGSKIE